ncbi:hypothetical protein GKC56_02995 [Neisseriaceae bacterium PsAf]|nr:hypothetical protein [Neisseriaceae bacterium PsAf]MCV2503394.1 phage holin family protein [Neisseriaceae bacterium]
MTDFKKVTEQFNFVKSNRSNIERLLKLRFEVISIDLTSLQKSILYGFALVGVALVFFLIAIISVFFGLNDVVSDPKARLWLFFGGSVVALILFFIFLKWAISKLTNSIQTLNSSVKDLGNEIEFLLGRNTPNEVSEELKSKIDQQLKEIS